MYVRLIQTHENKHSILVQFSRKWLWKRTGARQFLAFWRVANLSQRSQPTWVAAGPLSTRLKKDVDTRPKPQRLKELVTNVENAIGDA